MFQERKKLPCGSRSTKISNGHYQRTENNPFENITEGADATEECMLIDEDLPEDEVVEIVLTICSIRLL